MLTKAHKNSITSQKSHQTPKTLLPPLQLPNQPPIILFDPFVLLLDIKTHLEHFLLHSQVLVLDKLTLLV